PLLLNLPADGSPPDWNMQTRTVHEVLPDCDKLKQGVSVKDATDPNPVVVEQGWSLLHWFPEHHATYVQLQRANGSTTQQRCDQVTQVLYSDLARSQFLQYLD